MASRIAVFAYGTLTYLAFLAVFLYLIAFMGGVWVPRTLDYGHDAPLGEALIVNFVLIALFGLQHTIMARSWFKERWTKLIPRAAERSTFVLLTCGILVLTFTQWRTVPTVVWDVSHPTGVIALRTLFAVGCGIVLVSTFLIDHFELFGLRQVIDYLRGAKSRPPRFKVHSFYKYVRHPIMVGFLIAIWATPLMTVGHLIYAVLATTYIVIGVHVEERELLRLHGESYESYRQQVPRFVPMPSSRREVATQG